MSTLVLYPRRVLACACVCATLSLPGAADPLSHELRVDGAVVTVNPSPQEFPARYTDVDGVLTFRGGPARTGGSFGAAHVEKHTLSVAWKVSTLEGKAPWFGGAGWTGQPVLVRWPKETLAKMLRASSAGRPLLQVPSVSADDFVEVIQGSLDGHVYFVDLRTGAQTRKPIDTGNAIKGSVSLDPRGFPLLFVGQGIPERAPIGLRAFSLVTQKELWFLPGLDKDAPSAGWGAFDSSALVNRDTDTLVEGAENGLVYVVKLNTRFDPKSDDDIAIAPTLVKYRYKRGFAMSGIESSLAIQDHTAWFADNGGTVQGLDLRTLEPMWSFASGDDTDASVTLSMETERHDHAMIYTGNELDHRGPESGKIQLRKLDGLTGKLLWERALPCVGKLEPRHEPGLFATNVVGAGDIDDLVIFMVSRCPTFEGGTLLALDKATGKDVWKTPMKSLAWPSPTAFRDQNGKTWIIQADSEGFVHLVDARTGAVVFSLKLAGQIEASPAIFDSRIVLAVRGHVIYGIDID